MKSIVLTGFMGSGKSTAGKLLAGALGLDFIDLDEEIERKAGKPIRDIFAQDGEAVFRRMEHDTAAELAARSFKKSAVISTGGGFLTNDANAALFPRDSFDIIFVDRDFDEMYETIKDDSSRPVAAAMTRDELRALYEARLPYYRKYATRTMRN